MWGKMFVVFAAVVLLTMGVGPGQAKAAGKHNEIGKAGEYRGAIVKVDPVRCSADPGDKRYCKKVYLSLHSGMSVASRLHLFTEIRNNQKMVYAGPDEDKSMADQVNTMDKLVGNVLKPNTKATISVSCDEDGCEIDIIDLN